MNSQFPAKDPADTIDVQHTWVFPASMSTVTISASTWIADPDDLTIVTTVIVGLTTQARLSGGTNRTFYTLTNRITCSDGQIFERSTILPVRNL